MTATSDLQQLQQLNDDFIRSVAMSDAGWFDEHLAADFLNSNPDGSLVDRASFLAQIARPCPLADFKAEDVRIRIFSDVAFVHGRTVYTKPGGQPGAGRYTDIYARQNGAWRCVAAHVTRA
jgi:ketosteroid isomerase-like protein